MSLRIMTVCTCTYMCTRLLDTACVQAAPCLACRKLTSPTSAGEQKESACTSSCTPWTSAGLSLSMCLLPSCLCASVTCPILATRCRTSRSCCRRGHKHQNTTLRTLGMPRCCLCLTIVYLHASTSALLSNDVADVMRRQEPHAAKRGKSEPPAKNET